MSENYGFEYKVKTGEDWLGSLIPLSASLLPIILLL